ncbi:MAG: XRE family transcriptional regulator, partial [Gemmatimonadetes bacterium]|nr:XRE family transcriptional regulator [Gemmatimonadota bacterium]
RDLGEDPDVLLALAGKVSSDLQEIIRKRPKLFADLIRKMKEAPDHAILKIVREVRDGEW